MTTLLRLCSGHLVTGLFAAFAIVATLHFAGAQEAAKHFVMHEAPKAVGAISFRDERGQVRTLADFNGKVVLLNLWATWCVPCREEMSALDRLQAALGGPDFEVVPQCRNLHRYIGSGGAGSGRGGGADNAAHRSRRTRSRPHRRPR
jgi:hypothetical protein